MLMSPQRAVAVVVCARLPCRYRHLRCATAPTVGEFHCSHGADDEHDQEFWPADATAQYPEQSAGSRAATAWITIAARRAIKWAFGEDLGDDEVMPKRKALS